MCKRTHDDTVGVEILLNNISNYNIEWSNHIAEFMRLADRYHHSGDFDDFALFNMIEVQQ